MRISDWSSDVCSSDLAHGHGRWRRALPAEPRRGDLRAGGREMESGRQARHRGPGGGGAEARAALRQGPGEPLRSEEHTSELQSLMRISYAVFCLKKKKTKNTPNNTCTYSTTNKHCSKHYKEKSNC